MKRILLLTLIITATLLSYGQNGKSTKTLLDTTDITFRDTVFNILVDSISNNLEQIEPTNDNNRLVKHFKYIGTEPLIIGRAFTSDPHYICDYPKEPLVPNKIYSFTVCFWHEGRVGKLNKVMGFHLSNGESISFKFTGTYIPMIKQDE